MGELLWDVFPDHEAPGGAPANVAFHARQLGLSATVCSRVGDEDRGDRLLHHLESHGIDPRLVQRDPAHDTGTVTVDVNDPEAPAYLIHEDVAWDHVEWTPDLARVLERTRALAFGTLAQRSPTTRETLWRALEALPQEALGVYDVNLRPPWYQKDWIHRSLELASIAKYSVSEDDVLARLFGLSGDSVEANARTLLQRFGLEWVCVTKGGVGSVIVTPDETVQSPGHSHPAVEGADAVGAGDAFTASIIRARLDGWPPDAAGELANRVAALVAAHPGATPDVRDGVDGIREEVRARHGLGD